MSIMTESSSSDRRSFSSGRRNSAAPKNGSGGKVSQSGNRSTSRDSARRDQSQKDRPDKREARPRSQGNRPGIRSTEGGSRFKREDDRPRRAPRIEPEIPDDIEAKALPGKVRAELLSLSAENAEVVAKQMVMMEKLLGSSQPEDLLLANEFGRAASNRAGRVGVVRNLAGRAALAQGDFAEAKRHLSAALRISGMAISKILLAECETGLGRPRKSLEILGEIKAEGLSKKESAYAHLISAEAREALGQYDAARVTLSARIQTFLEDAVAENHVEMEVKKIADRWFALKVRLENV